MKEVALVSLKWVPNGPVLSQNILPARKKLSFELCTGKDPQAKQSMKTFPYVYQGTKEYNVCVCVCVCV